MLERMVFYGQTGHCRWKVLLENFGEAEGFDVVRHVRQLRRIAAVFAAAEDDREQRRSAKRAPPTPTRARR